MNLTIFQKQMAEVNQRVKAGELEARKEIALEIASRIISRTPVDTGEARANWNIGLQANDTDTSHEPDPTGQSAVTRAHENLAVMTSNQTQIFITNALPYINRLEHGHSGQAPNGMVQVTLAEFPDFAKAKLLARLGGKGGALNRV